MTGTKFTVCWKLHISFNKHNYQDFDSEPGGTLLRRADFITASQSADLQSITLKFLHQTLLSGVIYDSLRGTEACSADPDNQ